MTDLEVHFRGDVYKVSYEEEPINWIIVYLIFVNDPYLINLIGTNHFHVLQATNETQNTYWFSSKEPHDKETNEFKRVVTEALRKNNKEFI
jgi:hypothetical protein